MHLFITWTIYNQPWHLKTILKFKWNHTCRQYYGILKCSLGDSIQVIFENLLANLHEVATYLHLKSVVGCTTTFAWISPKYIILNKSHYTVGNFWEDKPKIVYVKGDSTIGRASQKASMRCVSQVSIHDIMAWMGTCLEVPRSCMERFAWISLFNSISMGISIYSWSTPAFSGMIQRNTVASTSTFEHLSIN